MPVDSKHREYTERMTEWEMLADIKAGEGTVKAKGTEYLPKLSGQKDKEYKAYLERGTFYGATARTITGLSGAVMRKPPRQEAPREVMDHLERITSEGTSMKEMLQSVVEAVISFGRYGVLVDYADDGQAGRPYLTEYPATDILIV